MLESIGSEEADMEELVGLAIAELRGAKEDALRERAAICRWFKRGKRAGFSTETLVDVLGVSSDVLDGAGYSDGEAQRMMDEVVADISDEEIEQETLEG